MDKLTIVELKMYHMYRAADTTDRDFRVQCYHKYVTLRDQRDALAAELTTLAKNPPPPFRQFKMYNDPHYRTP